MIILIVCLQGLGSDASPVKVETWQVYPHSGIRPLAPEVDDPYRSDFLEASQVLSISPKASAALSRRCLQRLLRDKANVTPSSLKAEIEEVVASKILPSYLEASIEAIRHYGNFAAHPIREEDTGNVIDVEPGEAEWLLDILEQLLDFYIIKPARARLRHAQLEAKISAGVPSNRPLSKSLRPIPRRSRTRLIPPSNDPKTD